MIDYTIRPVAENDLAELLVMMQEHADFEQAAFSLQHKIESLRKALFTEPVRLHCWMVEMQKELVGYVSFTFDFSTWDAAEFMYMDCLYLREKTRGLGIGTAIINRLSAVARERNCVNIQWQTPVFNEPAIKFYHKNKATSKEKVRFTLDVE